MNDNLSFGPAKAADAARLSKIAFSAKAYWRYPTEWLEKWRPQLTLSKSDIANETVVKLSIGSEIVGFYMLRSNAGVLWVEHLWLDPPFIGQGFGRLLFEHAIAAAREAKASALRIESDPNAEGFYAAMGAIRIGERRSEIDGPPRVLPLMEFKL
ncbi:MAG: GNAT family N-acetyltransferase [Pyrinomonadaceae bacterium]